MFMLINDDCLVALRAMPENSIDSLITDPPAGISFMGKDWDSAKGGRDSWIAWMTEVMRECHRVLKPGAHGLVWAIPRTSHWTATALENAGFEVRDVVTHLFGSGFPKSLDVSKAIDKAAGITQWKETTPNPAWRAGNGADAVTSTGWAKPQRPPKPVVESNEAKQWQGWGTALKPASEHWILIRKPISEKTVAANVLTHGVGGINIDRCRIGTDEVGWGGAGSTGGYDSSSPENKRTGFVHSGDPRPTQGRFPANLLLSHTLFCEHVGERKAGIGSGNRKTKSKNSMGFHGGDSSYDDFNYGTETVEAWQCTDDCPVRLLDEQSGECKSSGSYLDIKNSKPGGNGMFAGGQNTNAYANQTGGASRFFYCAKASKRERNEGLERERNEGLEGMPEKYNDFQRESSGLSQGKNPLTGERSGNRCKPNANHHPTVKPQKLMQYLITLITPPNGVVLDPFMGSGSTGVAAKALGFQFTGIEREAEYFEIAKKRYEVA